MEEVTDWLCTSRSSRPFATSARPNHHGLAERMRDLHAEDKGSIGIWLGVAQFERPVVTIRRVDTGADCN